MKPRLVLFVLLCILPLSAQTHILRSIDVPKYPPLAYQARVQGTVRIQVNISAEGLVTQATAVSGTPLLQGLALQNVKTWRFEPAPDGQSSEAIFQYKYKIEGKVVPFTPPAEQRARVLLDLPDIEISLPPMNITTDSDTHK